MAVNQFISPGADATHVQIQAPGDGSPIQVSNANLLFKGDYSRAGHDLEISGPDGHTITIEGYFASGPPSALVGPNGGMLNGNVVESLAGPLFPGQYAQAGSAAQSGNPIGEVQHLEGTATATRTDGTVVELRVGTEVYLGDVVETGASTKFGLSLVDGSIFSMTSDARMVLNEFVFNADQVQDSSMLVNIVQGAFVFVAGSIAPTGNMKVETPVAVLAIRGTTVGAEIDTELGSTELSLFQDIDSDHIGEYLVLDKTTGEIIGKVADVGSKLVFTGIGETPIVVEKTDLDLASDLDALELIRAVYAKVSGQQGEFDNEGGSGSFLDVQIVALGGSFKIEELSGNPIAAASALKVVVDNPDQDDPPVAFFDGFFTDEDDLFAGNVINNNSIQPDEDPEGFAVRVVGFDQDLIWEEGVDFDFVGGIISATESTTFVLDSGAVVEINAAGDFTYNPNPAFNYLADGESAIDSFSYLIADPGNSTDSDTVQVTVYGTNDRPVVVSTQPDHQDGITETAAVQGSSFEHVADGVVAFEDLDSTDAHNNATTTTPVFEGAVWTRNGVPAETFEDIFGSVELELTESPSPVQDPGNSPNEGTVSWEFTIADQDIDFLGAGETLVLTYTVNIKDDSGTANDATSQLITVTITGTNDVPLIDVEASTRDISGAVDELTDLSTTPVELATDLVETGVITFTDVDLSDQHTVSIVSTTGNVITGSTLANDYVLTPAQISALFNAFSVDDGSLRTSFDSVFGSTTAGDGTVDWTYSISDQDVDFLGANDVIDMAFDVTINDGNGGTVTETVTIRVTGTNDAPVITSAAQSGTVTETADVLPAGPDTDPANATGTISFSDVDLSDNPSAAHDGGTVSDSTLANGYALTGDQATALKAAFSLDNPALDNFSQITGTGSTGWTYDVANADIDFLGAGDSVELTYVVTVSDGNGGSATQDVVITINGTNDAPVITSAAQSGTVTETADVLPAGPDTDPANATGTISFSDVDLSDNPSAAHDGGTVSDSTLANGYALTGDQATALKAAFSLDNPALDNFSQITGTGSTGWTYDVANADIDFLGAGDSVELTYVVTVSDGNGGSATQDVVITINGTNDAPVVSAAEENDTGLVEAGYGVAGVDEVSGNVSGAWSDVDQGQTALLSVTEGSAGTDGQSPLTFDGGTGNEAQITGTYGSLYINADGTYRYVLDNTDADTQALTDGQSVTDSFNYTIANGEGAADSASSTITVDITGTNDAPTLAAVTAGSIVEDDQAATTTDSGLTGTLAGDDVDSATLTYGIAGGTPGTGDLVELAGAYGTLQLNTVTGAYEYVKDDAAIEALNSGDTATDSFTVTVSDGEAPAVGQTYTVNLTGADEGAAATASINWVSDPDIAVINKFEGSVFLGTEGADVFYVQSYIEGYGYGSAGDPESPALIVDFEAGEDLLYIDYFDSSYDYSYSGSVDTLPIVINDDGYTDLVNVNTGAGTSDIAVLEGIPGSVTTAELGSDILQYDNNDISGAISSYAGDGEIFLGVDGQADKFYVFSDYNGELATDPALILNFEPDQDVLYLDYLLGYYFSGDQSDVNLVDDGTDTTVQVNTAAEGDPEVYVDLVILQNVTGMEIDIVGPPTPPAS